MKSFVFIGAAISGNQGANLMFQMASKATRSYFPESSIALLSHYPNEDSGSACIPRISFRRIPILLCIDTCSDGFCRFLYASHVFIMRDISRRENRCLKF